MARSAACLVVVWLALGALLVAGVRYVFPHTVPIKCEEPDGPRSLGALAQCFLSSQAGAAIFEWCIALWAIAALAWLGVRAQVEYYKAQAAATVALRSCIVTNLQAAVPSSGPLPRPPPPPPPSQSPNPSLPRSSLGKTPLAHAMQF